MCDDCKIADVKEGQQTIFNYKDRSIFEKIFREWVLELVLFSYKITADKQESEDIVITTFTKVWESDEEFNKAAHLKSYIYSMVKNKSLNYLRDLKRRNIKDVFSENEISLSDLAEDAFIDSKVKVQLYKALESLPDKCRQVFRMNVIEGYTLREIAESLEVSENTVKTHKTRALKMLRDRLSPIIYALVLIIYNIEEDEI